MRVDVWVGGDLAREPEGGRPLRWISGWEDDASPSAVAAAERAWRTCNLGEQILDEDEQRWREEWDRHGGGVRLGVGDVVVVGDVALRCEVEGFVPAPHPGR